MANKYSKEDRKKMEDMNRAELRQLVTDDRVFSSKVKANSDEDAPAAGEVRHASRLGRGVDEGLGGELAVQPGESALLRRSRSSACRCHRCSCCSSVSKFGLTCTTSTT